MGKDLFTNNRGVVVMSQGKGMFSKVAQNVKLFNKKTVLSLAVAGVIAFSATSVAMPQSASACDCVAYYTVKKGDTLSAIGKKYGVTYQQLMSKNGMKSTNIKVGQRIIVPFLDKNGKIPNDDAPLEKGTVVYKIQKGDTLAKISKKHGVSVVQLKKDNYLQNDTIYVGRNLIIKKKVG
ncbi:hypothetical protein CN918_25935 [Priestia megaterium]|nr:hypothetical protein CN918_25935 [Priestia megaterium]